MQQLLEYSNETKKRNFLETVELQIGLKNCTPGNPEYRLSLLLTRHHR